METLQGLDLVRAVPSVVRAKRADGDAGMPIMEVRFSKFGAWYEINSMWEGRFLERTERGAFAKTIRENGSAVKVLFNHGGDFMIGDKILGTIESLTEEKDSPLGVVQLFDTSYNRDLIPGLEAGAYGSSFMFRVIKDEWNDEPERSEHNPDGIPERTIKEVRLMEFGPVTWPANPESTAGVRSLTDEYMERLAAREPRRVADLARARDLRTPPALGAGSTTPVPDGAARTTTDEPAASHSRGLTPAVRGRFLRTL